MTSFFLFFFTILIKPNAIRLHRKGMRTKKKRKEKKIKTISNQTIQILLSPERLMELTLHQCCFVEEI